MRHTEYGNTTTLRIEMDLSGLFQKTKKKKERIFSNVIFINKTTYDFPRQLFSNIQKHLIY